MSQPLNNLLLNDGTQIDVLMCGTDSGVLWVTMPLTMSVAEAAVIFSNPEKTSRMVAYGDIVHDGYTQLIVLNLGRDNLKAALRKV